MAVQRGFVKTAIRKSELTQARCWPRRRRAKVSANETLASCGNCPVPGMFIFAFMIVGLVGTDGTAASPWAKSPTVFDTVMVRAKRNWVKGCSEGRNSAGFRY